MKKEFLLATANGIDFGILPALMGLSLITKLILQLRMATGATAAI